MNRKKNFVLTLAFTALIICFIGSAGLTAKEFDNKPVADEMIGSSGISWVPKINYRQLEVTISRPDGTVFSKTIESGSAPYIDLSEIFGSSRSDGSYTYELRVIPVIEKKVRTDLDSGDNSLSAAAAGERIGYHKALTQAGAFLVKDGAIVTPTGPERESLVSQSTAPTGLDQTSDQVILDDLIVDGSACIGFDCVNGESFGFDTLRLKENNLRIKFQDTSTSASFPSNDWQITANDSASGGANRFSIDDIDGGRTPFTIEASAPSHSLYVDDGGRVGFGTSTPVADLHVKSGNTPTLRLEQDGSSGFTPQTWDVAGNEANFFIRDATNGSTLPIRIRPGAPSSAIDIASDGDIGIGTSSPDASLHVRRDGAAKLTLENYGTNGNLWTFNSSTNGDFRISAPDATPGVVLFSLETTGELDIRNPSNNVTLSLDGSGNLNVLGNITATGTCCADFVFEQDYPLMPMTDLAEFIKTEKHLPEIPSADEMKKNGVNVTELQIKLLQKVEELTLYTLSQQKTIDELKKEITELKKNTK